MRALCVAAATAAAAAASAAPAYDVLVYGSSPAGVAAAVAAGRLGLRVGLYEPLPMIGGMGAAGNLALNDGGMAAERTGLAHEFSMLNGAAYGLKTEASGPLTTRRRRRGVCAVFDCGGSARGIAPPSGAGPSAPLPCRDHATNPLAIASGRLHPCCSAVCRGAAACRTLPPDRAVLLTPATRPVPPPPPPPPPPQVPHPESFVAEASFNTMLAAANVSVHLNCRLLGAATSSDAGGVSRVANVTLLCEPQPVSAAVFIDASYDGEVVVAAGNIPYTAGREANTTYNESLAGVRPPSWAGVGGPRNVSALAPGGGLIKYVADLSELGPPGSADDGVSGGVWGGGWMLEWGRDRRAAQRPRALL